MHRFHISLRSQTQLNIIIIFSVPMQVWLQESGIILFIIGGHNSEKDETIVFYFIVDLKL